MRRSSVEMRRALRASMRWLLRLCLIAVVGLATALGTQSHQGSALSGEVVGLAAGFRHTCAVTTAGAVKCWGNAGNGRLGNGQTAPNQLTPIDPIGLSDGMATVAGGFAHTCGLTASGSAQCWGSNFRGPLGDGTSVDRLTPVDVCAGASCATPLVGAIAITAGDRHSCALMAGGGVKCWGANGSGQLGEGQACDLTSCPTPVDVLGLAGNAVDLSVGAAHTCAVISTGAVQCWGANGSGQLGDSSTNFSSLPVTVQGISDAVAVAAGGEHTCALLMGGGVQCWGRNATGQLGDGQTCGAPFCTTPVDVTGLTSGAASVDAGDRHTCAVITAGALKCWGGNSEGQLGDNQACGLLFCSTPVDPAGLGSGVVAVVAGGFHTCALLSDAKVRCWGANGSGQLGDGLGGHFDDLSTVPVDVVGFGPMDSDGDNVNDGVDLDDDNDGCADDRELSSNAALGGRRSPKVFWDFFDTPDPTNARDKIISTGDILRVVLRFGSSGDTGIDPMSVPLDPPTYHTAFDRSAPMSGGDPWDLGPPDGTVSTGDVLFEVNQFGHTCA